MIPHSILPILGRCFNTQLLQPQRQRGRPVANATVAGPRMRSRSDSLARGEVRVQYLILTHKSDLATQRRVRASRGRL